MELPKNTAEIAAKFDKLSEQRKNEIISHLAQTPGNRSGKVVEVLIQNGGPEGEFVSAIFGKPAAKK